MSKTADPTSITFHYERQRAVAAGIIETGTTTFLLLIAVKYFEAGATYKALIAAANSVGFLLSPFLVDQVEKRGITISGGAAIMAGVSAFGFFMAAAMPLLPVFAAGGIIGIAFLSACVPLYTQLYQENYPEELRGRMFSKTVAIRIAAAIAFNYAAGLALDGRVQYFQLLMAIFCAASVFSARCSARCPGRVITKKASRGPFSAMKFVSSDKVFRNTLICWMLMGFANLMMLPLRVEYLANPKYAVNLSVADIALLTGVIPNAARFILSPVWGALFDRMNFFLLRITLNVGFAVGILTFFTSDSYPGLVLGAVAFGISNAGGDIAWSLWVTKFAPEDRVADYMSVHSFFTGVRGLLAPFVAFYAAQEFELSSLGVICAGMIALASLLLFPEYRAESRKRKLFMLSEDVSE